MQLPDYQPPNVLWRFSPEICNIIFSQVFDEDLSNRDTLELMRASKQLHSEVGSYFYAHNIFNLSAPFVPQVRATILPPINDRYLRFLKHIGIDCEVGAATLPRVQELASTIRKLTTIGANFQQITFLIQFPAAFSSFLQATLDDVVMEEGHPITTALSHLLGSRVSDLVCIVLNGAWFAPGVATALKNRYSGSLKFMQLDNTVGMIELEDLTVYERPLAGFSSSALRNHFDLDPEDTNELIVTTLSIELDCTESIYPHEDEATASLLVDGNNDGEFKEDEELTHDDDIDMEEDLIPLDDGEMEESMEHLADTDDLLADQAQARREISYLVNIAPELLFTPLG